MDPVREAFLVVDGGKVERLRELLTVEPAIPAARDDLGVSIVLRARYRHHFDILEMLLAREPELDLHTACALGEVDRVAELLARDPAAVDAFAGDGFTPLQLAAFFGQAEVVRLLLGAGADIEAESRNPNALRALHSAAASRSAEVVRLLLEAGADPHARQANGFQALHAAAAVGDEAMIEALLARGADPRSPTDAGRTAAEFAEEKGHARAALLLRGGAR